MRKLALISLISLSFFNFSTSLYATQKGIYKKAEKIHGCAVVRQVTEYFVDVQYKSGDIIPEIKKIDFRMVTLEPGYVYAIYGDYLRRITSKVQKLKKMTKYDQALVKKKMKEFGEEFENDCINTY